MKWIDKIRSIFKPPETIVKTIPKKVLSDLNVYDDVWIKDNNNIYEGWVIERSKKFISVIYSDSENKLQDIKFLIDRPLDRSIIKYCNFFIYLNKSELPN